MFLWKWIAHHNLRSHVHHFIAILSPIERISLGLLYRMENQFCRLYSTFHCCFLSSTFSPFNVWCMMKVIFNVFTARHKLLVLLCEINFSSLCSYPHLFNSWSDHIVVLLLLSTTPYLTLINQISHPCLGARLHYGIPSVSLSFACIWDRAPP